MKVLHKIFGGINLTWLKVIILAVVTGIYTGLINQVPFLLDTSFRDIAISFEVWIFFGIFIIMNSKSNLDSALKCFVFFLISQPLVYLVEVPFAGWEIMNYYRNWILWTILTFPMGIYRLLSQKRQMVGIVYPDTRTNTVGFSLCRFSCGHNVFISKAFAELYFLCSHDDNICHCHIQR